MYYKKIAVNNLIIEFYNDWLGVESVSVNGQLVSKKASIMGCNHPFNVMEGGRMSSYILTSKVDMNMRVYLDLRRNQQLILENVDVPMSGNDPAQKNRRKSIGLGDLIAESKLKKSGLTKLQEYNLQDAVKDFEEALKIDNKDPETYFHLACAHSVLENKKEAFDSLIKAVQYNLDNKNIIMTHEMLAYLRMQDEFEAFAESGFTKI